MKLNEIGFYISPFSILLPIAALISVRKSLNTRRFQITSIFFIICLISEIFQIAFASIYKNNLIVLNIFAGIEFIFWCYFFFELLNFIFLRVLFGITDSNCRRPRLSKISIDQQKCLV